MKLNLGCGKDIKDGYTNVDCVKLEGVDMVLDLNKLPYPFASESIEEIYISHVIEHLKPDTMDTMAELYRILEPGGKLVIRVPFYNSGAVWVDPTHRKAFDYDTFSYFVKSSPMAYYFDFHFSVYAVSDVPSFIGGFIPRMVFGKHVRLFISRMIGGIINEIRVELIK